MSMLNPYEDRKKLKWQGFFLSEHTAEMAKYENNHSFNHQPKPEMTLQEISNFLQLAQLKNKKVALQLNYVQDGKFFPDVIGDIAGYNELGLYINDILIEYDEIRHIALYQEQKWFDVQN